MTRYHPKIFQIIFSKNVFKVFGKSRDCQCFYKKETLIKYPFDEDLSGKEDRYWAIDMVNKGYTYLYDGQNNECNHYWTPNGATWKGMG